MTYDHTLRELGYESHESEIFLRFAQGVSNSSFYRENPNTLTCDNRIVILKDTRFYVQLFTGRERRLDYHYSEKWIDVSLQIAKLLFAGGHDWWDKSIDQVDIDQQAKAVSIINKGGEKSDLPVKNRDELFRSLFASISPGPEPRLIPDASASRPDATLQPMTIRMNDSCSDGLGLVLMNRGALNLCSGAQQERRVEMTDVDQRRLAELKQEVIQSQGRFTEEITWKEERLYEGVILKTFTGTLYGRRQNLCMIEILQGEKRNPHLTPLVSKVSEALYPREPANHIGDGATIGEVFEVQTGAVIAVNLLFQHYLEDYYVWDGDRYYLGDPVGWNKIRSQVYGDPQEIEKRKDWGYLCQKEKGAPFEVLPPVSGERLTGYHYAVGCGPLICHDHQIRPLQEIEAEPLHPNAICPPGNLGHLFDRAQRTVVGIKDDGTLVFLTVDGRQPDFAEGMNYAELSGLVQTLGWYSALNLDGGGSTAIYDRENGFLNHPKEGDEKRKLCTLFLICNKE